MLSAVTCVGARSGATVVLYYTARRKRRYSMRCSDSASNQRNFIDHVQWQVLAISATIVAGSDAVAAAGSDTVAAAISSFFLAMTLHPETQRQAQEEIDRVMGSERLPTFDDRAQLPFLECTLRENYRWANPSNF